MFRGDLKGSNPEWLWRPQIWCSMSRGSKILRWVALGLGFWSLVVATLVVGGIVGIALVVALI